MNLFQRFTVWLVTKLLSPVIFNEILAKHFQLGSSDRDVLTKIYDTYARNYEGAEHVSFNVLALDHLTRQFDVTELTKLIYLKTLKTYVVRSTSTGFDTLRPYLEDIRKAKEIPNHMKRQAWIKDVVRGAFPLAKETEIGLLAHAAELTEYSPELVAITLSEI